MSSPAAQSHQTPDADLFDPTRSWVVTAGAGTGKTWRLARRYLRCLHHLHQQGHADAAGRILAVTFTRAAAAEMRERVLLALQSGGKPADPVKDPLIAQAQSWPESLRTDLLRQVASAPIDTIHAFCARLLGAFPELSGVVPGVRPIEPDEDALRRERFLRGFLDPILDESGHALAEDMRLMLREFTLTEVRAMVATAVAADQELPQELADERGVDRVRQSIYQPALDDWMSASRHAVAQALAALDDSEGQANRARELELVAEALQARHGARARKALGGVGGSRQRSIAQDGAAKQLVQQAFDALKNVPKFRGQSALAYVDPDAEALHVARLARILRLGLAARQAYADELASQGLMRFDDLERRTVDLLANPQAAQALAGRYAQLLVDEYQDTSPRQVRILTALERLCAAGSGVSTYKVGDVKQSIYRFRGAEVSVFRQTLTNVPDDQHGQLVETYRTRADLATAFNQVFPRLLQGIADEPSDNAEVPWSDADAIVTHRGASWLPGAPLQLSLAYKPDKPSAGAALSEASDNADRQDSGEAKAAQVSADENEAETDEDAVPEAAKVAHWIGDYLAKAGSAFTAMPVDANGKRWESAGVEAKPLQPKDIAILLPKWGEAETFRQALQELGIAAQISGGRGLKARPEVRDLANLVAFMADPTDHVAAAGVLRGPLAGISDLGLYVLARWPGVTRVQRDGTAVEWSGRGEPGQPLTSPRPLHQVALNAVLDPEVAADALVAAGAAQAQERQRIVQQLHGDAKALGDLQPVLNRLVARAGLAPTADLLTTAVVELRLPQVWTAQPEPTRVVANAWRMIELIRGVEADGPDLQAVLAWLDSDADPTPEGLIDTSGDAVTITTVHGAKGLEWRVVVLAGLHQELQSGSRDLLKLSPVAPLWEGAVDPLQAKVVPRLAIPAGGFFRDDDPLQALCSTLDSGLAAAEVKRLIYVGLTRAADRVVLSGVLAASKVLMKREKELMSRLEVTAGRTWRLLAECSHPAQMLVSVLRLQPNAAENPTCWVVSPDHTPAELAACVAQADAVVTATKIDENKDRRADLPAMATPAALANLPHAKPSKLSAGHWPANPVPGPLPLLDQGIRVAVPWRQDRDLEDNIAESQLGLLLHAAMEHWGCKSEQFPSAAVMRRLANQHVPGAAELELGWLEECLRRLEKSPLGAEMAAAAQRGELWHEVPLNASLQSAGPRPAQLLNGRIDALFRDAQGHWVVVDYKLVRSADAAALVKKYQPQLQAYRLVLEEAGLTPVGRTGLWSAADGVAIWA